jgi:hypothetical protein
MLIGPLFFCALTFAHFAAKLRDLVDLSGLRMRIAKPSFTQSLRNAFRSRGMIPKETKE